MRISYFVSLFVLGFSCTKSIKQSNGNLGKLGPTSNVSCRFTPHFTTFGANSFVANFPNSEPYTVDYICEKNGIPVGEAECRDSSLVGQANSQSFYSCPGQGSLVLPSSLTSGKYNLGVKGKDLNGDFGDVYLYSFAIDRDAPYVLDNVVMLSLTETSFGIDFQAIDPNINAAPSSGVKSTQCLLSTSSVVPFQGNWTDCTSSQFSASGLSPATRYYVWYRLEDNAGNVSLIVSNPGIDFTVINTEGQAVINPGYAGVCSIPTQFSNGYLSDDVARIAYSCPNSQLLNRCILYVPGQTRVVSDGQTESGFDSCDESLYQKSILSDGVYEFCVADAPGGTVRCKEFTRDKTKPTVEITSVNTSISSAVVRFRAVDSGSGIDRFTCALLNRETDKVYNALGMEVSSVEEALNNTSLPCGMTGVDQSYVTFDASLIGPRAEYTVYVKAYDRAALYSSTDYENFLVAETSTLSCLILDPRNGEWKNSTSQSYRFQCAYPSEASQLSFKCQVENVSNGAAKDLGCNTSAPQCYRVDATLSHSAYTLCLFDGNFTTNNLPSGFASSGDTLRVKVVAQDKLSSGTVLASTYSEDTFKVDTTPAAIPQITVNASSSEVQVSYTAQDPGAPTRGSGLRPGTGIKVYEVVNSSTLIEMTNYDLNISGNDLRFSASNFNPAKNYRVDLSVSDNVNNSSTEHSLVFPGPNPNPGPTCQLSLIDGFSVDPTHPISAAMTHARIVCFNAFEEASTESDHTTKAQCRITSRDIFGNPVLGPWGNCTGTNATLVNNAPFAWGVDNNGRNNGEVKLEVYGCDSTYTYRCGPISHISYYYGKSLNGAWSNAPYNIIYKNGDTQTQYEEKVCNNPVPSLGGAQCALDTFQCVTTPCNAWSYGNNTAEGYLTEYRKKGTCLSSDYVFNSSPSLNRCVPDCSKVGPNMILNSTTGQCQCASGYDFFTPLGATAGSCVSSCSSGFVRQSNGSCACPSNMVNSGGTCSCPYGQGFDSASQSCKPLADNGGWSAWSSCSANCGSGTKTRTCLQPAPQYIGGCDPNVATNDPIRVQSCNTQNCCSKQAGVWHAEDGNEGFSDAADGCSDRGRSAQAQNLCSYWLSAKMGGSCCGASINSFAYSIGGDCELFCQCN